MVGATRAARLSDRSKRPTVRLSDVARRAQCSAATVSRVLNTPESVNREARTRVEQAVRDLGYTRNAAARALRSRRSQIVGLILPTLKQAIYADFIDGVQESLARQDYSLIVTTSDYSQERELLQARLLAGRGIDGLVLIGHTHRPELYDILQAQELPFVTTHTFQPGFPYPMIGFDNVAAMRQVVDHLIGLGHRDFAVLAGCSDQNDRMQERIRGAVAALEAAGLPLPEDRIVEVALTIQAGRAGLRQLMETGRRPTALICTGDLLAYGALVECKASGIAVPADLSMVGFDDLQASAHLDPPLTSVTISGGEMGRHAADYLLARFAGRNHVSQFLVETRLMVRATTAPPPPAG